MTRHVLAWLIAALSACSTTRLDSAPTGLDRAPVDSRWVASLYFGQPGSVDQYLARISDLVDGGQIQVIGFLAPSLVLLGEPAGPALLLTGNPDALATVQDRFGGPEPSGGRSYVQGMIGWALTMPRRDSSGVASHENGLLLSMILLKDHERLDRALALIGADPPDKMYSCHEFRTGTPPGAEPRPLLVVEAGWQDLHVLTEALHAAAVPFAGFLYCRCLPLLSGPIYL